MSHNSSPLEFSLVGKCSKTKARAAILTLPHGSVQTPVFMPVGTQGTIKGLTSEQVSQLNCKLILGNTYHLGLRPGSKLIAKMGGLHNFMKWNGNLLTDSGGFQMVSLFDLATIKEEGVYFQSPVDGSEMLLTPELSIQYQNEIGADIMMALDDVCSSLTVGPRVEEAAQRTIRWIDRCIKAHKKPKVQNLFGIIQGGLDPKLRDFSLTEMLKRDAFLPGYAIGGLAGGESKADFWRMVHQCTGDKGGNRNPRLPMHKPRYLMGVGYPIDLLVCVALGVDMFDCVWPCRTARFGTAIVSFSPGYLNLKKAKFKADFGPIDPDCHCPICKNTSYTRSYLHSVVAKVEVGCSLLSLHNLWFLLNFMRDMRTAIIKKTFPKFVENYIRKQYPKNNCPEWVVNALSAAGLKDLFNKIDSAFNISTTDTNTTKRQKLI